MLKTVYIIVQTIDPLLVVCLYLSFFWHSSPERAPSTWKQINKWITSALHLLASVCKPGGWRQDKAEYHTCSTCSTCCKAFALYEVNKKVRCLQKSSIHLYLWTYTHTLYTCKTLCLLVWHNIPLLPKDRCLAQSPRHIIFVLKTKPSIVGLRNFIICCYT